VALEQAALMAILCANRAKRRIVVVTALRFALAHAWPVLRLTIRMVGATLLIVLPFLMAVGAVYLSLLGGHDINFYLKERPPVFLLALGLAGIFVTALAAALLRVFSGWFYALPMVLFEDVSPRRALRASAGRTHGHRLGLVLWLAAWALALSMFSAAVTSILVGLARYFVPMAVGSVGLLALAIGTTLSLWALVNLALNLLGTTSFSAVLFGLYLRVAGAPPDASRVTRFEHASPEAGFQVTRRGVVRAGIVGVLAAAAVGAFAVRTATLEDNVKVIAHRGSSKAAPENTMAAFRQAIADGTDWVELDVQETADGEVVVFHDSDFMKMAGVSLKIWDATLADLAQIDIGSWFAPEFSNERVPTLGEVLDACKGKVGVFIELKYYGHDQQLEERVARIVEARGMEKDIVVMSLKLDAVQKMKALRPDWRVGLLLSASAGDPRRAGADFLAINALFADRGFIRRTQRSGAEVYVWTVNDAATMSAMMSRGVDGVITDKPALAKSVLAERAQLGPFVRLLLELAGILGLKPDITEL
jgi:glycerophosphoryl diester phosphodiesterase